MFPLNNSVDANYNYNNNDNDNIQHDINHQLYEHPQHQHRLLYYMSSQLVYYYSMFVFFLVLCLFVGCYPFDCRTPVEKEEDERRLQLEAAGIILEEGQRAINVHRNADDVTVIEEVNDDDDDDDDDDRGNALDDGADSKSRAEKKEQDYDDEIGLVGNIFLERAQVMTEEFDLLFGVSSIVKQQAENDANIAPDHIGSKAAPDHVGSQNV